MDIELARTFLEVVAAGSFIAAADRLHITQSTVSTRIRMLETELGARLFTRNKSGAVLTSTGTQFLRHAAAMVRIWRQAQQEAALPPGHRAVLRVGAEAGIWNRLLYRWIPWMRSNVPEVALRCEVGLPDGIAHSVHEGMLDIGVMYSPLSRPGLQVHLIREEELVLLEGGPAGYAPSSNDYIHVDWGEEFHRRHRIRFPDFASPALFVGLGTLGFDYLLRCGGSGYFPLDLAKPYIETGYLRVVPGSDRFPLPIYAVHPGGVDPAVFGPAIEGLKTAIGREPPRLEPTARPAAPATRPAPRPPGDNPRPRRGDRD